MASNLHSMPPEEPTAREAGQDSTETTNNQAIQSDSRPVKNRTRPSRASTQAKDKDSGASSSSNRRGGFSSLPSTQQSNLPRNPNSTVNRRLNNGAGQNSIHSTATSTRPSFLDSQWRTHSTQSSSQQVGTPSTADTECLTQALQQLTTEDKAQNTATTTKATKSRWRTAKPNSNQQTSTNQQNSNNNPATTSGKTPSTNSNPKVKAFHIKAHADLRRSQRQKGGNPRLYLLPEPKPSQGYLERANLPPRRLTSPKKLLIVLDLNGTLLVRSNRGSNYTPRPHVDEFLAYCLEYHKLIVWSSARPHNVKPMVGQLFNKKRHAKLVKVWSREHLRLGEHYDQKVQVYKQLTWLWEDADVQASFPAETSAPFKIEDGWKEPPPTKWDQSNTVLLDDSTDKAASEPYNLIRVDEFTTENKDEGDEVLSRVMAYLEDLKWEADVSAAMRVKPFVNGEVVDPEELERPPSA